MLAFFFSADGIFLFFWFCMVVLCGYLFWKDTGSKMLNLVLCSFIVCCILFFVCIYVLKVGVVTAHCMAVGLFLFLLFLIQVEFDFRSNWKREWDKFWD